MLSANSEIFCYLCIGHIFALLFILLTILGAQKHDHFSATAMLPDQCNNPFSKTTHKIKWKWRKLKKISLLRDAKLVISNQFRFFSLSLKVIFFQRKANQENECFISLLKIPWFLLKIEISSTWANSFLSSRRKYSYNIRFPLPSTNY